MSGTWHGPPGDHREETLAALVSGHDPSAGKPEGWTEAVSTGTSSPGTDRAPGASRRDRRNATDSTTRTLPVTRAGVRPGRTSSARRASEATGATRGPSWISSSPARMGIPRRRVAVRAPRSAAQARTRLRRRRPLAPRSASVGMPLLLLLSVLALFVAWVSAEPFWMAVGHHERGTVEVTQCTGRGDLGTRCSGTFTASGGGYVAEFVTVSGADIPDRRVGATLHAQMVSPDGRTAYAGGAAGLHLRWATGFVLLVLFGLGIGVATGAWRFRGRARARAVTTSLLLPLLTGVVVLATAY